MQQTAKSIAQPIHFLIKLTAQNNSKFFCVARTFVYKFFPAIKFDKKIHPTKSAGKKLYIQFSLEIE